jgi:hypothetical protein
MVLFSFAGIVAAVVYFLLAPTGVADASTTSTQDSLNTTDRFVDNVSFGIGEKLTFDVNYGFINAGTASMEVVKMVEFKDRQAYQIQTRALSNSFFSSIYRVEDEVESIFDADGLFSWRFQKKLREGSYRADRSYEFDQTGHVVFYEKDTLPVAPFVQDALSALYYVRTQPLEVGNSVWVESFVDGKSYKMEVKVLRKETIKVAAGSFDCVVVEPITQAVGVFKHEGRLTVWMTDDRLKMPVLMKSKVLVGSISAELTDFILGEIREY